MNRGERKWTAVTPEVCFGVVPLSCVPEGKRIYKLGWVDKVKTLENGATVLSRELLRVITRTLQPHLIPLPSSSRTAATRTAHIRTIERVCQSINKNSGFHSYLHKKSLSNHFSPQIYRRVHKETAKCTIQRHQSQSTGIWGHKFDPN